MVIQKKIYWNDGSKSVILFRTDDMAAMKELAEQIDTQPTRHYYHIEYDEVRAMTLEEVKQIIGQVKG